MIAIAEWTARRKSEMDDRDPEQRYFVNQALDELAVSGRETRKNSEYRQVPRRNPVRRRCARLTQGLPHHFGVAGLLIDQQELDFAIAALGKEHVAALSEIVTDLAALQRQCL